MSHPTPVPLGEIERLADEATEGPWFVNHNDNGLACVEQSDCTGVAYDLIHEADAAFIASVDPSTVRALAGALRIAVEGLRGFCRFAPSDHLCSGCRARAALAAVRELVDLGEKP